MKRVAILTIHAIRNCGSALQAHATQEVVRKLGCSPFIIDYAYPNPIHRQTLSAKGQALRGAHRLSMVLFGVWPSFRKREVRYRRFMQTHLDLSEHYPSRQRLMENPPPADIYVSGSDQIWHPRCIDYDTTFLLDFVPPGKRKVAFASSFGVERLNGPQITLFQEKLASYDYIAVREKSGQGLVQEMTGVMPKLVPDPTLLLSAEEWHRIEKPVGIKKPFILLYGNMGNHADQMEEAALAMRRLTGFKIVKIHGRAYQRFSRKIHYRFDVGPREFLWLFHNASFVLANSFHGTVFSVMFNRQFLSFYPKADMGTRQRNLLELLDLRNRGMALPLEMDMQAVLQQFEQEIDYVRVRSALAALREDAVSWLGDALS